MTHHDPPDGSKTLAVFDTNSVVANRLHMSFSAISLTLKVQLESQKNDAPSKRHTKVHFRPSND
jgi:hypothetical protein